jgi:hypothetical protein
MGNNNTKPYDNLPIIIKKNKDTINLIQKKIDFNIKRIENEIKISFNYLKQNKKMALFHLKKKKMIDRQNDILSSYMLNLEKQGFTLEDYMMSMKIIDTFKRNSLTMKLVNQNLNKIDDVIESINEKMILCENINEILNNPLGNDFDDDELLKELDNLDVEKNNKLLMLPELPKKSLYVVRDNDKDVMDNEKDAMDNLEKMMS